MTTLINRGDNMKKVKIDNAVKEAIKNYEYLDKVFLRGSKGTISPLNGPYYKYIEDYQQIIEFEKDILDSEVNEIIKNLKIVIGNELKVTKHINQRNTHFTTQLRLDYRGFNNE